MSGFRFRFKTVLKLRRHHREVRRRDLARARVHWESLTARARTAHKQTVSRAERLVRELASGVRAGEWVTQQRAVHSGRERAEHAAEEARGALARLEALRLQTVDAQRAVKVLERLEARGRSAHRLRQERRRQRELDEVGSLGWMRRGNRP